MLRQRSIAIFIGFLVSVLASQHLAAQDVEASPVLPLDQAIDYAMANNPEIKAFENEMALSDEDIDFAKSGYRPNVSSSVTINHVQSDNNLINDWQSDTEKSIALNLTQPLYTGGQTSANVGEQKKRRDITRFNQGDLAQRVVLDTVNAYMAVYRTKEASHVNAKNVQLLSDQRKAAQARFDAGELTKTDVSQARARLSQAIALEASANASYKTAVSNFEKTTTYDQVIDFAYPDLKTSSLPSSVDEAIAMGLDNNPNILGAQVNITAQDFNIRQQQGAFYPSVDLNAGLSMDRDPAFSQVGRQESANASVVATLPIYQSGVLRNQLRQAKILRAKALDDLEVEKRDVINSIIGAWENYQSSLVQIEAREAQLQAAELAYEGVRLEEEVGARSILDVLDANQDVLDAQLSLLEVKTNKVNSHYALMRAMGVIRNSSWDKS